MGNVKRKKNQGGVGNLFTTGKVAKFNHISWLFWKINKLNEKDLQQ